MIIVWGSIETTEKNLSAALELSLDHVRRSRLEPGCISHSAHIDAENNCRIVFYEEWKDRAALQEHFALPASQDFVGKLSALTNTPPRMKIFQAEAITL